MRGLESEIEASRACRYSSVGHDPLGSSPWLLERAQFARPNTVFLFRINALTAEESHMTEALSFGVDPKLATLLGSSYKSTEQAIKELVDNAWDADAQQVDIALPDGMTSDSIVIADDGSGMTVEELKKEYLKVARDRRSTKGDLTLGKRR